MGWALPSCLTDKDRLGEGRCGSHVSGESAGGRLETRLAGCGFHSAADGCSGDVGVAWTPRDDLGMSVGHPPLCFHLPDIPLGLVGSALDGQISIAALGEGPRPWNRLRKPFLEGCHTNTKASMPRHQRSSVPSSSTDGELESQTGDGTHSLSDLCCPGLISHSDPPAPVP